MAVPPLIAYVGTYTPNGQGIHRCYFNPSTGQFLPDGVAAALVSPSWLTLHPAKPVLYAVSETSEFNATATGSITSFSVDTSSGALTPLNVVSSAGTMPVFASVDPRGEFLFVANYGNGNVAVFPIQQDGGLADATHVKSVVAPIGPAHATHAPPGSAAVSGHDGPHPHQIKAELTGQFVLSIDLGQDRTYVWSLDRTNGKLHEEPFVYASPLGDGPRQFALHPNGQWIYLLHEVSSTIEFLRFNASKGNISFVERTSSLPVDFAGTSYASEIMVSRDGKFVYVSNRLHNSIAVFRVLRSGRLRPLSDFWTHGDYPRSFAIDPSGAFLCTCNQRSDNVSVFAIERAGKSLRFVQHVPIGSPACIVFLELQ